MTVQLKRVLLAIAGGSALAVAPLLYGTAVMPAVSHADQGSNTDQANPPPSDKGKGLNCPDGTVVDEQNHQCVDLVSGISKQLEALPPLPSLAEATSGGGGGGGFGGLGGLSGLPGGIPSLGTVNLPDIVLPSLGLGLVPNLNVSVNPQLPNFNPLNLP